MATVNSIEPASLNSSATAPDDLDEIKAQDIRSAWEGLMTNDEAIRRGLFVNYTYYDEETAPPFTKSPIVGSGWLIADSPWQDTAFEATALDAAVDDDIEFSYQGSITCNVSNSGPNFCILRFKVVEDSGGTDVAFTIDGSILVPDPAGAIFPLSMRAIHRITTAGDVRVVIEGQIIEAATGTGVTGGDGTWIFLFSQRLDIRHIKRKAAITNEA